MKKNILITVLLTATFAISACGNKTNTNLATDSNLATSSNINDKELKEFESITSAKKPSFKDMGTVNIPDLKTITIQVPKKSIVSDKDVQDKIDNLLYSHLVSVDREIKNGDIVNISYVGKIDDVEFEGGSAENYDLKIGSNTFIPGYEEQLIGHKKGDVATVNVKFPDDYTEKLKGKDAVFSVTINDVKEKPELNDELVKQISLVSETVDEYKVEIRTNLEKTIDADETKLIYAAILKSFQDNKYIEPSEKMLKYERNLVLSGINKNNENNSFTDFLTKYNLSAEDFKNELKEISLSNGQYDMIIDYFIKEQNLNVNEINTQDFINYYSLLTGSAIDRQTLVNQYGEDEINKMILERAVFDYIKNNVNIEYTNTNTGTVQ